MSSPKEKQYSYFRVLKVAESVRMFQCVRDPKRFIRIKDGQCDGWGNGDVYCHFKIHKYKLGGYVTLQSMKHKGVFIGLNSDGKARPTVDTGDVNTQLYPEVITFGETRREKAEEWRTPEPSFIMSPQDDARVSQRVSSLAKSKLSSRTVTLQGRERSNPGPVDGDFRIYVTTGNWSTTETIILHVYGDKGSSGAITLGKGSLGGVFQCGQTDEFQANLSSIGRITKIRVGVEEVSSQCQWRLKQVKMKDMMSEEIWKFKFNRWISRLKDDGATLRELPALTQDGKPVLPILRYFILVRTSKESARLKPKNQDNPQFIETQHEIYICLQGQNGDTGRRMLLRKPEEYPDQLEVPSRALFAPGQLDRFEIEAVSLGELTKCVISFPTSLSSSSSSNPLSWLCEEIIVRESEGATKEYVFQCNNKWLGIRKVGAKPQVKLELSGKRDVKKATTDTEYKDGDWKISVTTGNLNECMTSANVMFYACGLGATSSGPVFLGSGAKGLFAAGTTEQFKVNLSGVKDIYKVRLSHNNSGPSPSWYVEKIKLQSMTSDETHTLDVRKWLSLDEEPYQLAVEVPIQKPGVETPAVLRYQVLVYTGSILGSDTEANVYISIYGKDGDTGRRNLTKSLNNDIKFQEGQVDIFEVEAVCLGDLTKIEIGHDGIGHGNGWFLHKVIVKESQLSSRDFIFFCNRWLDDGQDDGKIERVIYVEPDDEDDEDNDPAFTSEGKYNVLVTTGTQSSSEPCPVDSEVTMVIYGEEGKTGKILLKPNETDDTTTLQCFKPGQIDEFQIEVPEIGSIYKIRLSINRQCDWSGWFVEEIILEDAATKQRILFNCKRWLSKTEDDQETIREFAVAKKSGKSLPVHLYYVNVTTGDRPGASTDANIYLTLRGERGDSGIRKLVHQGQGDLFPFQRNTTSSFIVEAVDLGTLTEVVISHNGQGYGSGWFVEKISVRESEFATVEWLFLGNMWLDDHIGDCKTVRRLRLLGSFDVSSSEDELVKLESSPNGETPQNASNEYDVTVIVDEVMTEANDVVSLKGKVYGSGGVSETFSLGDWRPGNKKTFTERVDVGPVTEISKIRVEMEDSSRDFNLLLISVTMKNVHTEELLSFNFDRKFRTETGSTVKELPTLRNHKPHKKLMSYYIYVEMSPSSQDAAMMGKLQIKISGENSDSGFRTLFRGMDGLSAVKRDNGYVFEHEAVDLGQLSSIAIVYDTNETNEGGWQVGDVLIRVPAPVNSYATEAMSEPTFKATVDQTFDSTFNQPTSYSLKTCNSNSEINKTFEMLSEDQHKPVRPLSVKSKGTWRLQVTSSSYDEKTLFNQVTAKIFGTRGESDVYSLSSPDFTIDDVIDGRSFDGQVRTKDLKLGSDIGELYLLRLTINKDSLIRIYKAKLKDVATNQEYLAHLTPEERMHKSANEHGVFVFNLPLVKPDQEPFQQHTYEVKVKTGDVPAAATDADIKINIIGTSGETGLRSLKALANHPESLFQLGKIDSFVLESVDVGEPRKVTIGHTASGEGAGWFLDDIIISEVRDDLRQEFNFYCHKWFDDSVDDKLTMRDIYVMGTKLHQSGVDVTKSKGNWKCHIYSQSEITEHKEFDLRLTLCMSENKSQDVVRHISKKHDVIDVQFDHYEPPSPSTGEVTSDFVKIRAQIETSSDDIKKSWPIEECVMVDEDSAEKLRFVFDSAPVWENSARGQLRELPVVRSDRYFQPVINYYVIFYTSSQSPRDFEPSRLTCQLHGQKGTTGWRTLVSNKNSSGKFQPGRVDVFTIEAVSLGDVIDLVSVCIGGPLTQPWTLEKVKVKRDYYDNEEMIFEYNQNISQDEVVELRLSNSVFVYSPKPVATGQNSLPKSGQSQTKFDLEMTWTGLYSLTSSSRDSSETPSSSKVDIPVASLQLTGSKGRSDITSVDLKKANLLSDGKQFYQSKISVSSSEFGNLVKVGIGILEPALPVKLIELHPMLCKVTLKNCVTNQYYCFRPNHSFFDNSASSHDNQSGFNWLELAATRPRQDPSTIAESCEYVISIRTSDQPDAGTKANVYIILVGKKADSGKRWLLKSSTGNDVVYTPGEEVEFKISGCNLKDLTQVTIGHDGRDVTSGWHLDKVAVTSSLQPNKQFVFVCKKWLADLQEDTFIERTLELDHVSSQ